MLPLYREGFAMRWTLLDANITFPLDIYGLVVNVCLYIMKSSDMPVNELPVALSDIFSCEFNTLRHVIRL